MQSSFGRGIEDVSAVRLNAATSDQQRFPTMILEHFDDFDSQ
jgi:hypothetical protein